MVHVSNSNINEEDVLTERQLNSVEYRDELLRNVRNPDGHLYAYRDGDEHVVVSLGNEPDTYWSERFPAKRQVEERVELWTIPDNYIPIIKSNREEQTIYRNMDTGEYVLVELPGQCRLVDQWMNPLKTGDLTIRFDLSALDKQRLNVLHERAADGLWNTLPAIDKVLDNWGEFEASVKRDVEEQSEMILFEILDKREPPGGPLSVDSWTFSPFEFEDGVVGFDVGDSVRYLLSEGERAHLLADLKELLSNGVVPMYPEITVTVEPDYDEMITRLADAGLLPRRQVEAYVYRDVAGFSRGVTAERMGINVNNVDETYRRASAKVNGAQEIVDVLGEFC